MSDQQLAIDKKYIRLDTGEPVIQRVEEWLRSAGFGEAILWVLEGNDRAERFYRAGGWEHDGGSKVDNFQGATVTELRYRKRL